MTSMRSRTGPGIVSSMLAVPMNITFERSNGNREVVVAERRVLLRVEHFEQRRGRIAVEAGAELVHLVQHHHGIARAGLADRLDDVARHRADVGAAMAADLGLVVHAAEAQAHELAAGRARDALPERRLADARRADEAQDRALALRIELAHREIFEDAPLDLGEAVMVLVEDAARFRDVDRLGIELRPRQLDQPIEIGADHPVFGSGLRHALEPLELLLGLLFGLLRHLRPFRSFRAARRSRRILSSPSPSSFWIWRSCSRRMCSRCCEDSVCWVCSPISFDSFRTSMRWISSASTLSRRSLTSIVSRISCFSTGVASMMPAMKSASADGESRLSMCRDHLGRNVRQQAGSPRARVRAAGAMRASISGVIDLRDADLLDARDQEGITRKGIRRSGSAAPRGRSRGASRRRAVT